MPTKIVLFFALFYLFPGVILGAGRDIALEKSGYGAAAGFTSNKRLITDKKRSRPATAGKKRAELTERHEPLGPSIGEKYNFELRGFYWSAKLDATLRSDEGELEGTEIDFAENLGIDERKGLLGGEATVELYLRHKLKLAFVSISYDSRKVLEDEITFKGDVYPVNTPVSSKMNLLSTRFGYEYDVIRGDNGFFGLQLAANLIQAEVSLVTNDILSNSARVSAVIPMVIAAGRIHFSPHFSGTAELGWMEYESSSLFDAIIYLDYNPVRHIGVTAGWRAIMVDAEQSDTKIDVRWSGIFAGLILRI